MKGTGGREGRRVQEGGKRNEGYRRAEREEKRRQQSQDVDQPLGLRINNTPFSLQVIRMQCV